MQNFNDYYFFREVAELMNPDSNIKFNSNGHRLIQAVSSEFGPILHFTYDWNLNSKKYPRGDSEQDTKGYEVSLSPELTGSGKVTDSYRNHLDKLATRLPALAQQIAGAIGKFTIMNKPGTLNFRQVYADIESFKDLAEEGTIARFKIMLEKAIRLSIKNTNSQMDQNQSYTMMGDQVVRRDAVQQKATSNSRYSDNMRDKMNNHDNSMSSAENARKQMRQQVVNQHQDVNDLWAASQKSRKPIQTPEPTGMVPSEPMIQPQSPPSPQIPHKSGFNRWFSKKSAPQMI